MRISKDKDGNIVITIPKAEVSEEGKVSSTGKTALHYYAKSKVKVGDSLRNITVNYSSPLTSDADIVSL